MIDERIAERRAELRGDRQRSRLRRTRTIGLLLVLLAAVVAIERSPLVGLEEVRITGISRLDESAVHAAADLELGTSTLRLRLGEVTERVEALPLVRQVRASRVDPLTVHIEVVEREPVLNVTGGGVTRLLDRDGVVIAEERLAPLPEIVLAEEPPAVGETVSADPALGNAHRAWRGLSGPLRVEVASLVADGPEELTLRLDRGMDVRFGRGERLDEKVRALGAILHDLDTGDSPGVEVAVIDVRAPSAPVIIGR